MNWGCGGVSLLFQNTTEGGKGEFFVIFFNYVNFVLCVNYLGCARSII